MPYHRTPRTVRALAAAALVGVLVGAGGLVALAEAPKAGFAPDPPVQPSRRQWVFSIVSRQGKVTVETVLPITVDKPTETARIFGRWALELYIGRQLLDRVRFNVPLMGDEPPVGNRNRFSRPSFNKNVSAKISTQMADNPRGAYLVLVDRESGDTQRYLWPPEPDGRLLPWKSMFSDAGPGDFAEGGTRVLAMGDGGPVVKPAPPAAPVDAGRD